jgi:hypothetical protein
MRIKLDENLPDSLLASLVSLGHDVDNVRMEGLSGRADADVWQAAQRSERYLITQDLDFSDMKKFAPGTHQGLLLVRLRLPGRIALARRVLNVFQSEDVASWARCFVLLTDWKIRIHRPKT